MRRPSSRRLLRRFVFGWFAVQISIILGLMGTTKVRKIFRGRRLVDFPRTAPTDVVVDGPNDATVYTYGADLFDDMIAAIEGAREQVLFETYIIKGDGEGRRFKQALIAAADRGVDVRIIYDGFANLVVNPAFLRFPAHVKVLRYPVWSAGLKVWSPRRIGRDHRKILVVDGQVGFVGGYNVGSLYATQWRDTHLRLAGPSVWDLTNAFVDFWNMRFGGSRQKMVHRSEPSWLPSVRVHRNIPRQLMFPIRSMYLEAIDRATRSIDITAAYFIPDHDILAALLEAAERGVRVRILLPEVSNHVIADWLSRGFYSQLLQGGIEIWQYRDAMVHAKTATIDQRWSTIGTANIDRLSLTGNYEINVELVHESMAKLMCEIFEHDLTNAKQLTRSEWERRNVVSRLCEFLLAPLRPLL